MVQSAALVCLALAAALGACRGEKPAQAPPIKRLGGTSAAVFPKEPVPLSRRLEAAIAEADDLFDLFPLDHLVKLESVKGSALVYVECILHHDDSWLVLDPTQATILRFSENGRFLGTLGSKGQGPGEYQQPDEMRACWDGGIAVYDGGTGRIIVYNRDLTHRQTTQPVVGAHTIHAVPGFVWPRADTLVMAGIRATHPEVPWHIILDYASDPPRVVGGFGHRFEPLADKKLGKWGFRGIDLIEGILWTAPPYSDHLEVFDGAGVPLAVLRQAKHTHPIQPEDFEGVTRKSRNRLFVEKAHNGYLKRAGPLVLVSTGAHVDIYDVHGNLLRANLPRGFFRMVRSAYEEAGAVYVVSEILPLDQSDYYDPSDFAAMQALGYDLRNMDDENVYLRVGRLPE